MGWSKRRVEWKAFKRLFLKEREKEEREERKLNRVKSRTFINNSTSGTHNEINFWGARIRLDVINNMFFTQTHARLHSSAFTLYHPVDLSFWGGERSTRWRHEKIVFSSGRRAHSVVIIIVIFYLNHRVRAVLSREKRIISCCEWKRAKLWMNGKRHY